MKSKNICILMCITALARINSVSASEETSIQRLARLLREADEHQRTINRPVAQGRPGAAHHTHAPQPQQVTRPLLPPAPAPAQRSYPNLLHTPRPAAPVAHDEEIARRKQIEEDAQLARRLQKGTVRHAAPHKSTASLATSTSRPIHATKLTGAAATSKPSSSHSSSVEAARLKQIQEDAKLARRFARADQSLPSRAGQSHHAQGPKSQDYRALPASLAHTAKAKVQQPLVTFQTGLRCGVCALANAKAIQTIIESNGNIELTPGNIQRYTPYLHGENIDDYQIHELAAKQGLNFTYLVGENIVQKPHGYTFSHSGANEPSSCLDEIKNLYDSGSVQVLNFIFNPGDKDHGHYVTISIIRTIPQPTILYMDPCNCGLTDLSTATFFINYLIDHLL